MTNFVIEIDNFINEIDDHINEIDDRINKPHHIDMIISFIDIHINEIDDHINKLQEKTKLLEQKKQQLILQQANQQANQRICKAFEAEEKKTFEANEAEERQRVIDECDREQCDDNNKYERYQVIDEKKSLVNSDDVLDHVNQLDSSIYSIKYEQCGPLGLSRQTYVQYSKTLFAIANKHTICVSPITQMKRNCIIFQPFCEYTGLHYHSIKIIIIINSKFSITSCSPCYPDYDAFLTSKIKYFESTMPDIPILIDKSIINGPESFHDKETCDKMGSGFYRYIPDDRFNPEHWGGIRDN